METLESKIVTINPKEKNDSGLLVSGEVFISGNRSLFGIEAALYEGNKEIQRYTCCPNGSFYFKLNYEKKYTIVVSKAGLESKFIEFDTSLMGFEKKKRFYDFGVTLGPIPEFDHEASDHKPAAIIKFFGNSEAFLHDQEYHENRLNLLQEKKVA